MLCGSSTLACLYWLCNGNWRFMTPAGVTNHQRREAWRGKDEQRRTAWVSSPTPSDWLSWQAYPQVHRLTRKLTHMQTCSPWHDTHANHTLLVSLLQHNGRLGRMCGRDHIFPPPFLAVWWFLSCTCERPKQTHKTEEAEMERNRFAGGLK